MMATMLETTQTTQTTNIDHKAELRQWLEQFADDYFVTGKNRGLINGAAYRATERSLNPQGKARTEKALATTKSTKNGNKVRTSMSRNAPTWSKRANTYKRHVPQSTIYNDAQGIASELWGYLAEFVNLVQFDQDGNWSLEWKRSKKTKRIFRRSGNLENLHKVLLWAAISAAVNEKKSADIKNSELRSYDSDESLELVANETLHSLDLSHYKDGDSLIFHISSKVYPDASTKNKSLSESRLIQIANKRRQDQRTKLNRQLAEITHKKSEGMPLDSSERVLLFRLRSQISQDEFIDSFCRVENVPMSDLAFGRPKAALLNDEYGPHNHTFTWAYMGTITPFNPQTSDDHFAGIPFQGQSGPLSDWMRIFAR